MNSRTVPIIAYGLVLIILVKQRAILLWLICLNKVKQTSFSKSNFHQFHMNYPKTSALSMGVLLCVQVWCRVHAWFLIFQCQASLWFLDALFCSCAHCHWMIRFLSSSCAFIPASLWGSEGHQLLCFVGGGTWSFSVQGFLAYFLVTHLSVVFLVLILDV